MMKGYKYRLYPTDLQKQLLDKHMNACRFVYNIALETKNAVYLACKKSLSPFELMRQLTDLKRECIWLKEVDSQCLQQAIIDLDKAFTQFFKGNSNFPGFKGKKHNQTFRSSHPENIKIINNRIKLPKFKEGIRFSESRTFEGELRNATISKTRTGRYYISFIVQTKDVNKTSNIINSEDSIGIDLGIKSFITTSNGNKYNNPKYLKSSIKRIKILQKRMSRKKKGSSNKKKANKRVGLLHEKIKNQRKDFLHKLSTQLVRDNQTICCEDLRVKNMMKNHCLAGSIADAGWGMFVHMLEYKCEWLGKNFLQIPTFQASSKVCSNCGWIKKDITLADREWDCHNCNEHHDRDINAAKVIKQYCLNNSGQVLPSEPVELPTLVGAVKQEGVLNINIQHNNP